MKWTIGADIEMMLEKHGSLVSAVPVLGPQNKDLPFGDIFPDNVLAEFTVTPASSADDFIKHISENMKAAKRIFELEGLTVRIAASGHYPEGELQSDEASRFGCSPDYDAYELCLNEVACGADETTLRSAGGHIHFAHPIFEDPYKVVEMIKLMDLYLGVPSVVKDASDESNERRKLYGKAGAHRPKGYPGGEYRTLSNFWTKDDDGVRWAYQETERCLTLLLEGKTVANLGIDENEVRRVINEGDVDAAQDIVRKSK